MTNLLHEHESLSVRDDLRCVQSLLEILEELLPVTLELVASADELEDLGGAGTLALDGGETAGEHGFGDQGNGHAEIQSIDGSPFSGSLLACRVENLLEKWGSVIVVKVHDVAGDFDQEGVKNALVPGCENITDLLVLHSETAFHDIVGLRVLDWSIEFGEREHTSQINCMSPYSIPL